MEQQNENQEEAWDAQLKHRERLFVLYYCTDEQCFLNATASYKATYTKKDKKTGALIIPDQAISESAGSRLLRREKVKVAIKRLLALSQEELDEKNTYKILAELTMLASYNPADILDAKGRLKVKNLSELGEKAKCIAQITPTKAGLKYTLYDRNKALDKLVNYLNIVRPEQQIDVTLPIMEITSKENPEDWNKDQNKTEE